MLKESIQVFHDIRGCDSPLWDRNFAQLMNASDPL